MRERANSGGWTYIVKRGMHQAPKASAPKNKVFNSFRIFMQVIELKKCNRLVKLWEVHIINILSITQLICAPTKNCKIVYGKPTFYYPLRVSNIVGFLGENSHEIDCIAIGNLLLNEGIVYIL